MSPDLRYATRAATFSLQCAAILEDLQRRNRDAGFHAYAARTMAEGSLDALESISANPENAESFLPYCTLAANRTAGLLRAYLNGPRNDVASN